MVCGGLLWDTQAGARNDQLGKAALPIWHGMDHYIPWASFVRAELAAIGAWRVIENPDNISWRDRAQRRHDLTARVLISTAGSNGGLVRKRLLFASKRHMENAIGHVQLPDLQMDGGWRSKYGGDRLILPQRTTGVRYVDWY